jgi:hypothetical protein
MASVRILYLTPSRGSKQREGTTLGNRVQLGTPVIQPFWAGLDARQT